jgi:anti-sigma B factor antagonist
VVVEQRDVHWLDAADRDELPRFAAGRPAPNRQVSAGLDDGVGIVTVTGELDGAAAAVLWSAASEMVSGHAGALVLDLAAVTFLSARGLAVLVRVANHAGEHDIGLSMVAPAQPHVLRLLDRTDLADLFEVHDSLADGRGAAAAPSGRGSRAGREG